jgi:hypothetical protein
MMMIIPPNTYNKIKNGVTYIGELFNLFGRIHNKIDKMPNEFGIMMAEKAPQILRRLSAKK